MYLSSKKKIIGLALACIRDSTSCQALNCICSSDLLIKWAQLHAAALSASEIQC